MESRDLLTVSEVRGAQRFRAVGDPVLRQGRSDQREPDEWRTATVRAQHVAAAGIHPCRPQCRLEPRRDRRRARNAAGQSHTHPRGLDPAVEGLATTTRRSDRGADGVARQTGLLHRMRVPVAEALCDLESVRRRGRCRAWCGLSSEIVAPPESADRPAAQKPSSPLARRMIRSNCRSGRMRRMNSMRFAPAPEG